MAQQGKAKSLKDLNEIRSLIKKHKKNDFLFAATGMFVIASLTITLIILFLDLIIDGYPKFNLDFFPIIHLVVQQELGFYLPGLGPLWCF